jgi:hypothetical protein
MKNTLYAIVAVTLLAPALIAQAGKGGNTTSKTFKVAADTKINTADKTTASLADLKVGDKVGLAYKEDGGALTLSSLHVMGDTKGDKGAKKGASHKGDKAEDGLRARGTVTAIDKAAGTITVDVKEHNKKS